MHRRFNSRLFEFNTLFIRIDFCRKVFNLPRQCTGICQTFDKLNSLLELTY